MTVKLRTHGWEVGGKFLPWLWGQINYWDHERLFWRDVLRAYAESGRGVVSTTILPNLHLVDGQYDFSPERTACDLAAFLQEVKRAGLKSVAWLGPRDVPGAIASGYPGTILNDPEQLAADAQGRPLLSALTHSRDAYALPCLIGKPWQQELGRFSRALEPVLGPCLHPDGPVIGLGATLAPGWDFAQAAFGSDYHPAAIRQYQAYIKKRYKNLKNLQEAYEKSFESFEQIQPPASLPENLGALPGAYWIDWARFREEYFTMAADILYSAFAPLAQERVPLFLNVRASGHSPINLQALRALKAFSFIQLEPADRQTIPEGRGSLQSLSQPLVRFQFSPVDPPAQGAGEILNEMAAGVRGWEWASPCGAGAYPGLLVDRLGNRRQPLPEWWQAAYDLLNAEGFAQSQPFADIVVCLIPELEHSLYLQAPSALRSDLAGPNVAPILAEHLDPVTRSYYVRRQGLLAWLERQQYAFQVCADPEWPAQLRPGQVAVIPGTEAITRDSQTLVVEALEKGFPVVWVGPLPEPGQGRGGDLLSGLKNEKTTRRSKEPRKGKWIILPELSEERLAKPLKQLGVIRELVFEDERLIIRWYRFRNRNFVSAYNPTNEIIETAAGREGKFVLKDFWPSKKFYGGNLEIRLSIPARTAKCWELLPC